jgi:hypothetical protein
VVLVLGGHAVQVVVLLVPGEVVAAAQEQRQPVEELHLVLHAKAHLRDRVGQTTGPFTTGDP